MLSIKKEIKWKYFLRPGICGLHQGYLKVGLNKSFNFFSTQFDHS